MHKRKISDQKGEHTMSSIEQDHSVGMAGHTLSQELHHPRTSEGVFLPEAWQFDESVVRIEPKKTEIPDAWGNQLSRYRVVMSDGTKLGMNICEPRERVTDTPIIETPAWFTNLHGFNEHTQRAFGSLGIPSILVGHVGQERDSFVRELSGTIFKPWQSVREMRSISLARQAHNMLEIFQYPLLGKQFDTEHVFIHGNSRGAMVQFPFMRMAEQRGIHVAFAMPVAPCFAKGWDRETMRELSGTPIKEVGNVARLAVRNLFDMAGTGANTINLSPKSILYELAHTDALFNGDAGKFAHHTRKDQDMLILAYNDDLAGQHDEWEDIYKDHPNVHVRSVPGSHLSIADVRTRAYVMRTFDRYAEQLRDGEHPTRLDHSHVRRTLRSV